MGITFKHVVPGQRVTRMLAGVSKMVLTVESIDYEKNLIRTAGGWDFCRSCGAEIDADLGWGHTGTGSFLVPE